MFNHTSRPRRHRRVITQDGEHLGWFDQLKGTRTMAVDTSIDAEVRAAVRTIPGTTMALRVPQAPPTEAMDALRLRTAALPRPPKTADRPVGVPGMSPEQQLKQAFVEIDRKLTDLAGRTELALRGHIEHFKGWSRNLAAWLGGPRRFTSAHGDVARMQEAYDEGGTAELTGLADQVRAEILRRAKVAAA